VTRAEDEPFLHVRNLHPESRQPDFNRFVHLGNSPPNCPSTSGRGATAARRGSSIWIGKAMRAAFVETETHLRRSSQITSRYTSSLYP
jgi:hypothetical protein